MSESNDPEPGRPKIIQIQVVSGQPVRPPNAGPTIYALRDDGTVWRGGVKSESDENLQAKRSWYWERIPEPPLEGPEAEP
jgi:hypothetical protein